ncbi:MAG: hypothetical protein WC273_08870 [Dehalococcoidia bacterium]
MSTRTRILSSMIAVALLAVTAVTFGPRAAAQTPAPGIAPGEGPFVPTPVFSSGGLALVVYMGSTIDGLEAAAGTAGATGVWVQDRQGVFQLLPVRGPAFLRSGFEAAIPSISGLTPVILVRSAEPPPITLDQHGSTVTLHVGDRVLLMLGETYTWTVDPLDTNVVRRVPGIAVIRGAQGVYEAVGVGSTDLSATGDPLCRQAVPACAQPSRLFRVHLVVAP